MLKRLLIPVLLLAAAAVAIPANRAEASGYGHSTGAAIGGCDYACSYSSNLNTTWYYDHSIGYVGTPTVTLYGCSVTGSYSASCQYGPPSCYRWSYGQYNCDFTYTAVNAGGGRYTHLIRVRMFSDGSWDQYGSA